MQACRHVEACNPQAFSFTLFLLQLWQVPHLLTHTVGLVNVLLPDTLD